MTHKVYNWQLKREMDYKYPEARPKRQVAWIFDTNKCIACQTCTMACKMTWTSGKGQEFMFWNNVETKPWGYHPLGWDVRLLEKLGPQSWNGDKYTGKTIFEAVSKGFARPPSLITLMLLCSFKFSGLLSRVMISI